tara:strand:- start:7922 stop:8047 length:126 start_codon:yes stop_codon:yes gene_type:complete
MVCGGLYGEKVGQHDVGSANGQIEIIQTYKYPFHDWRMIAS